MHAFLTGNENFRMLEPSAINDQFTAGRIDTVGNLLVGAHQEVIDRAEIYDNGWSLGCRSYAWRSSRIVEAVRSGEFPWLGIVDPSLRFVFSIGGTHVNMYRGTTEKPKTNILSRATSYPELRQMGLFSDLEEAPSLVWSYAMETGPEGEVIGLQFVGLTDDGDVIARREVPIDEIQTPLSVVSSEELEPFSAPPAPLSVRKTPKPDGESKESKESEDSISDAAGTIPER